MLCRAAAFIPTRETGKKKEKKKYSKSELIVMLTGFVRNAIIQTPQMPPNSLKSTPLFPFWKKKTKTTK